MTKSQAVVDDLYWFGFGKDWQPINKREGDPGLISAFLRYFRYFLIGVWISCLSPLLFEKMKIGRIEAEFEPRSTAPLI